MDRRQFVSSLAALGGAAALPVGAQAQSFPNRNMTIIVPFPPGGQADLSARPIGEHFRKKLGKPVIVENRSGGGGKVGNAAAARAAPDGHTLLMALSSISVLPEADRMFGRKPTYELADLRPIARVLADPTMLAVHKDAPWKTVQDLAADARKNPGTIPFGSSGPYGALHVPIEMFCASAGIRMLHVPFTGAGPAIGALINGTVKVAGSGPGIVKPQADAGNIRILACFGGKRVPAFPDVPTFQELGYKDVEFYLWSGLFAPAKTPEPIIQVLREGMRSAMNDPAVLSVFTKVGGVPAYQDEPEFKAFVAADAARLIAAVKKIGKV